MKRQEKPSLKSASTPAPVWLTRVMSHATLINLFADYIPLPCHVVPANDTSAWYALSPPDGELRPYHFQLYYGKEEEVKRYFQKSFEEAARSRKPVLGHYGGFYDYFLPVVKGGRCIAFVVSGSFSKSVPNLDQLIRQFTELSGRSPGQSDTPFLDYCREVLKEPVLEEAVLAQYRDLLQAVAHLAAGDKEEGGLIGQIEKMKAKFFSQRLPTRMWNYAAVKEDRLRWTLWQRAELAPWDREEFHLSRHPTVVLAVMLQGAEAEIHPEVVSMIRATELQLASFHAAGTLKETLSGRMGQEGAYFLTSPDPSKNPVQAKLQVRDLALSAESILRKKFQGKVFIGVSSLSHSPQQLPEAFQESIQALHLGLHLSKPLLFFEDHFRAEGAVPQTTIYEWAPRLVDACSQNQEKEIQLIRERYIKEAIQLTGKKLEILRTHFLHVLFLLLELLQKRGMLLEAKAAELRVELMQKFDESNMVSALSSLFRFYLDLLTQFFHSPIRGERNLRLEQAKEYIEKNFQNTVSLKETASRAGLSASRFSRTFKEMYGVGFLEHLTRVRCDHAKRLLESTRLPVGQVSVECGFHSINHFIQCFKRRTGTTPREYGMKSKGTPVRKK